jgi:hypothetical protein
MNDNATVLEILTKSHTIAVVGISDKPWRASSHIAHYLDENGYKVVGVNPALEKAGRISVYPTLAAAKLALGSIDLVNIFRAPEYVPAIVEEAIALDIPYLWLQDEVIHEEAVAKARAAGIKVVENDCIFRQHAARGPELNALRNNS